MKVTLFTEASANSVVHRWMTLHHHRLTAELAGRGIELLVVYIGGDEDRDARLDDHDQGASDRAVDVRDALRDARETGMIAAVFAEPGHLVGAATVAESLRRITEGDGYVASASRWSLRPNTLHAIDASASPHERVTDAFRVVSAEILSCSGWQPLPWGDRRLLIKSLDTSVAAFAPAAARSRTALPSVEDGDVLEVFTGRPKDWWALASGRPRVDGVGALRRHLGRDELDSDGPLWLPDAEPLVAASMIARVEDAHRLDDLVAALRSVRSVADEAVVVLDARSIPEADSVLREMGARVVRREWTDDFAAARNHADSLCRAPWTLVIDADEILFQPGDLRERIEHAQRTEQRAVGVIVDAIASGGRVSERLVQPRAYLREACRWRYPVHNELTGLEGAPLWVSSARIESSYVGTSEAKAERSLPTLLERAAAEPAEPRWPRYIATTMSNLGRSDEVERWARKATELAPMDPAHAQAWIDLTYARLLLGGEAGAPPLPTVLEALRHHSRNPDVWHTLAAVALLYWERAARTPPPESVVHNRSLAYVRNLPAVAELLGLPIAFGSRSGNEIDAT